LTTVDPWLRRHLGIYTTPAEVVSAQVHIVDDVLRRRMARAAGLGDPDVAIVDPAVGSGAYPLGVVAHVGPERLVQRLHLWDQRADEANAARQRLRDALGTDVEIHARDVLAEPVAIDAPVLVCIGNPPYNRQTVDRGRVVPRKGGWVRFGQPRPILDDFVDATAGVHVKSLYNDYVYFWRWAVWQVCEQRAGPGVVSLITPTSFLSGPGFGAMRAWLRQAFDELWVLDLEGDGRGTRRSENVFEGVQTPVAICMGVRYGEASTGRPAQVHHARLAGTRARKLAVLGQVGCIEDVEWQAIEADLPSRLTPCPGGSYESWPRLTELFPRQFSGCQMKRRWPIAPTPEILRARWATFVKLRPSERELAFRPTRDRTIDSAPHGLMPLRQLDADAPCPDPVRYAYRSFDRQWVLADPRLGDFLRPALWHTAGPRQLFLTSLLTHPLGPGPSAVVTKLVPDLDHFRGSFGGRAVMPLWLDASATQPNLAPGLLPSLSDTYGTQIAPEAFLAYCYALLSAPRYQARFADELRTPGARVPLTANAGLFARAVELGQQLVRIHTYEAVPKHQGPVSPDELDFSVSGLNVTRSWLRYRRDGWSTQIDCEWSELVGLIVATLTAVPALDALLDEIVNAKTLARYPWTRA
jgi:predicted helicase